MENKRDIDSYFEGTLQNIDTILNDNFYENKKNLHKVQNKVERWFDSYKKSNSLKGITPNELENIGLEITDFFSRYVETEPANKNYSERLSYDFGKLEILWKKEMLGDKLNG